MSVDLIFWQNALSIHQAPLLRSLADQAGAFGIDRVVLHAMRDINVDRTALGWRAPDYGNVIVKVGTSADRSVDPGAQHMFSGLQETPENHQVLGTVLAQGGRPLITLESPRRDQALRYGVRRIKYLHLGWQMRRANLGLLPMGQMGMEFYHRHGFAHHPMAEFGYFPQPAGQGKGAIPTVSRTMPNLCFVGSLDRRKGLAAVFPVLAKLKDRPWQMTVVGDGPLAADHSAMVTRLGLNDRVRFLGALPNDQSQAQVAASDALILPSLYDGWGAVVNESLLAGTPVLVSRNVGAATLVRDPALGQVFDATRPGQIQAALTRFMAADQLSTDRRAAIAHWAAQVISPQRGAAYMLALIAAHRAASPLAQVPVPWHDPFDIYV